MERVLKQRLIWVRMYKEIKDADFVCRRCGISRPTLRKWLHRYRSQGLEGLEGLHDYFDNPTIISVQFIPGTYSLCA